MKFVKAYRSLLVLFAAVLTASMFLPVFAADAVNVTVFTDIKKGDWFYEDVKEAARIGMMVGISDTEFHPYGEITVGEAYALLARLHADHTGQNARLSSLEKRTGQMWYQAYLDYLTEKEIIGLDDANALKTIISEPINRAEMIAIFSKLPDAMWKPINDVPDDVIPDVPASDPYAPIIYRAYRAGIIVGTDEEARFTPEKRLSRAEVAALVIRLAEPERRLTLNLGGAKHTLYAADGSKISVSTSTALEYLERGWSFTPYTGNFDAEKLLNSAKLTPTKTGYEPLDRMVDAVFAKVIKPSMTTSQKVKACYNYLIENCTYGSSPVSGKYRTVYKSNPYSSPDPTRICTDAQKKLADRGYTYFYIALNDHAEEAYTVMYASEMLDGKRGLCDHFSSAFAVMMRRIGLPCFPLYVNSKLGNSYGAHMTTVMSIGGVDCIFDPQIEQVIIKNIGANKYKRFAIPIADMGDEYKDFDNLEDCRHLFGPFQYDPAKMKTVNAK